MQHSRRGWGPVAILLLALTVCAEAQTVTVPDFVVHAPVAPIVVAEPSVATRVDGTILITWREYVTGDATSLRLYAQEFSSAGVPLAPPNRVDGGLRLVAPEASATSTGEWVMAFRNIETLPSFFLNAYAGRLDAAGVLLGAPFRTDQGSSISGIHAVAGLPTGAVFQWGQRPGLSARLYDVAGVARGPSFAIDDNLGSIESDVAALADGGFVSLWNRGGGTGYDGKLRLYDGDGQPRTGVLFAANSFVVDQVAMDPSGSFGITGTSTRAYVTRFDNDGHPRSGVIQVSDDVYPWRADPDLEFDSQGNAYVVWTTLNYITSERGALYARALGTNNAALGPPVVLRPAPVAGPVRTAHLPNDTFVNVWADETRVWANIVSLCPAGASLCGDGVQHPQCEQCDAGAANSDTTPNACRSNCRRASCGDHVIDAGEECDDGNRFSRDGCDQNCRVETCGNGRRESSEICDDGNLTDADGCDSSCSPTGCGSGVLTAGEECDDGNAINQDGCDQNCLLEVCGNGRVEAGEPCDDANLDEGDGCDSNCTISDCGNLIVGALEECDDGNTANDDGCDASCRIEICGDGRLEGNEGCDDGNTIDDDGCQADCEPTAQVDALLAPLRPLRVRLPASGVVQKRVRLRVAHAGVGAAQSVRLVASDGSCPAGTVSVQPDFDPALPGVQDVAALEPHQRATALMTLAFARASFSILDRSAPQRCSVSIAASAAAGTFDVNGANNLWALTVDVADAAAPNLAPPEVLLRAVKAQAVVIPPGALGVDRRLRVRLAGSAVTGATVVADDGDCPPGTLSVTTQPGASPTAEVLLRASRSFFTTTASSPARCNASLSVMQVGDSEPTNNSARVTLDVTDHNDF